MTNCSATPREAAPDSTSTSDALVGRDARSTTRVDAVSMWSSVDRHVRLLDLGVDAHVVEAGSVALLPDPFGGRPELATQVALDGTLAVRRSPS